MPIQYFDDHISLNFAQVFVHVEFVVVDPVLPAPVSGQHALLGQPVNLSKAKDI